MSRFSPRVAGVSIWEVTANWTGLRIVSLREGGMGGVDGSVVGGRGEAGEGLSVTSQLSGTRRGGSERKTTEDHSETFGGRGLVTEEIRKIAKEGESIPFSPYCAP